MEKSVLAWTVALCLGLAAWLHWEIRSMPIYYEWHSYLLDPKTARKTAPSELIDLGRVINYTEGYINRTNSIQRLYDLEYQMNLENPFSIDQSYANKRQLELSGWPVANQTRCGRELKWINEQLSEHPNYQLLPGRLGYELTRLLDSFGKPETGLYAGTLTWLGSYKQCLRARLDGGRIKLRYCQAKLKPIWWPQDESVEPKTRIKMGLCLPESCDTLSFNQHKSSIERLVKFELAEFYKQNFEFDSLFCLPDERSPIRQLPPGGHLYLLLACLWLSFVLTASIVYELTSWKERKQRRGAKGYQFESLTILDAKQRQADGANFHAPLASAKKKDQEASGGNDKRFAYKLQEALSIHNSLKEFKSNAFKQLEGHKRARVDLGCLDCVKITMAILVVLGHSGYLTSAYTRSITNRIDINVNGYGRMALSVGRCVDTFFIFFGILTAYTLLRKFTPKQLSSPLTWALVNLGILLRISPVFLLIYWYARLISPYTGSGPWWDYGVLRYSPRGSCLNEPWWKSIPYLGCSGSPPAAFCVLPAWFIVSYSQLSLLMPLVTYLMYKLPNHLSRHLLIAFVTIISGLQLAFKMYGQTSFKEEALTLYGSFVIDLLEKFQSTGTMATLGRAGCVTMGCYVGYLLRQYELGQIKAWPKWLINKTLLAVVVVLHFVVVFLPLIGHLMFQNNGHTATMDEFVGSYLVTMFIWPILNSIVVINCVTQYHRTALIRFFAHSFWHIFNKLGLCIFLVHWEVLFVGVTSHEQAPSVGFLSDVMKLWSFGVFFSILLAFAIHILFEAPLSALLKLIANSIYSMIIDTRHRLEEICDEMQPQVAGPQLQRPEMPADETHGHVRNA